MLDNRTKIKNSSLYNRIIDERNIYYSIYSVDSYVFEKNLLDEQSYNELIKLKDKFDTSIIDVKLKDVKRKLEEVLLNDELFSTMVFRRPKKIKVSKSEIGSTFIERDMIESRPLHVSDLDTQIAIASILNALLFDENKNNKLELNELGRILPPNFYGNIPSEKPEDLFIPWQKKYKDYSSDIKDSYSRYLETKEFKYEVMVDLENFFPSIQPAIVFENIINILSCKYSEDDMRCLKIAIFKLLYLKIDNKSYYDGYYNTVDGNEYNLETLYTQGIPQGLPQAYLFGNICMIEVSKIFAKVFNNDSVDNLKAFYYVDDSVIYTNKYANIVDFQDAFYKDLKKINEELLGLNISKKEIISDFPDCQYKIDTIKLDDLLAYNIKVHESGKSEITSIVTEKLGSPLLSIMNKMASMSSFELVTTFSDEEEKILLNKFRIFEKSIVDELDRIKLLENNSNGGYENYKKYLIRLKKFMKFRNRLLTMREEEDQYGNHLDELLIKLEIEREPNTLKLSKEDIERFFDMFDEDILTSEIFFILKNNSNEEKYQKIKNAINEFDKSLYGDSNTGYFSKVVENLTVSNKLYKKYFNKYEFLNKQVDRKIEEFSYKRMELRSKKVIELIEQLNTKDASSLFSEIHDGFKQNKGWFQWVNNSSDELYRQVLNVRISKIYGVQINDDFKISKTYSRPIKYVELRILAYIKNRNFKLSEFSKFVERIDNEKSDSAIDSTVLDVLEYFNSFVKEPAYIDNLIMVHKFTNDIWKNGSKFLHFYTLHNHEHAVELIKGITTFIKSIDFFQIGRIDYYILFISCYLHDISMVLHPDITKVFISEKNCKSNLISANFKNRLEEILGISKHLALIESKEIKKLLISYFKIIDVFFENTVRDGHQKDSAIYIRKSEQLYFINDEIREIVAEISEAHGFNVQDVYGIKSNSQNALISKKFIKILLRIGDLLDVSENRVADEIMINNKMHMSDVTQFHWLTHQAISGYTISTDFKNTQTNEKKSYLSKKSIEEKVTIKFILNFKHHITVKKPECKFCFLTNDSNSGKLSLKIRNSIESDSDICTVKDCNYICKWMTEKNAFLFEELFALQRYLNRTENNYFDTIFEVKFESSSDARFLNADELEIVNKQCKNQ